MGLSQYAREKVADHVCGTASFTMPATVYVGLCSEAAPNATTFTEIETPGLVGYARQLVAFTAAGVDGSAPNSAIETFGPNTDTVDWTTAQGFGLFDAATGGNRLTQDALTTPKTVGVGDSAQFAAGALVMTAS